MRHSHAVGPSADFADHDRPLTPKGLEVASARGAELAAIGPDLILCSSARRAVQTMEGLGLDDVPQVVEPSLYQAGPEGVLHILSQIDAGVGAVLLIGHMPTVAITTRVLLGQPGVGAFRPAGAAVMTRKVPWQELSYATCELQQLLD